MFKFILIFLFSIIQSEFITIEKAKQVAMNQVYSSIGSIDGIIIDSVYIIDKNNTPLIYSINLKNYGFVLVSADDRVFPVLGYSSSNYYSTKNQPIQFSNMINSFKQQILYAIENNFSSNDKIKDQWLLYLSGNMRRNNFRNVNPLMSTNWDQGHSWNDNCPQDNQGPGGNVYAGCVATAAAMVMKYWNHPENGEGTHSYNHPDYGIISVDFNTIYNWASMSDSQPTDASRKLLFHVGVSCEMDYGVDGSGAWVGVNEPSVLTGLKTYFKYNDNAVFRSKDEYPESTWLDIVRMELDQGRPLIYKGYTSDYSAGHAFVIDGYNDDYFHLNWGWSGSYNGNYLINNLSPGGYNFSTWQGAIFQLYPENEQIMGCMDLDACNYNPDATIDDGSCGIYDCFGECSGDAILDECGICDGDGSECAGNAIINFGNLDENTQTFDINFESDVNIAGFQFTITDHPDNIILDSFSGGFAENYNFSVSCSDIGIVIGFSFNGDSIPYGSGILTTANYTILDEFEENTNLCLTDVILSNELGNAINIDVGSCVDLDLCTHSGNVNDDSIINIQDVVILANMAITQENLDFCQGDINIDGVINVQDIVILVYIILNL